MRNRYFPGNINEDIKLGKIIPLRGLIAVGISVVIGIALCFILPFGIIINLIIMFFIVACTLATYIFDIPKNIDRKFRYNQDKKKSNLEDFNGIQEYGTISKTVDNAEMLLLEYAPPPFEVMPEGTKDSSADKHVRDIFTAIKNDCVVSVYGMSCAESTAILETRLRKCNDLNPALQRLEKERISFHNQISEQEAKSTQYFTKVLKWPTTEGETILESSYSFLESGYVICGKDYTEHIVNTHLTPSANLKRG